MHSGISIVLLLTSSNRHFRDTHVISRILLYNIMQFYTVYFSSGWVIDVLKISIATSVTFSKVPPVISLSQSFYMIITSDYGQMSCHDQAMSLIV